MSIHEQFPIAFAAASMFVGAFAAGLFLSLAVDAWRRGTVKDKAVSVGLWLVAIVLALAPFVDAPKAGHADDVADMRKA